MDPVAIGALVKAGLNSLQTITELAKSFGKGKFERPSDENVRELNSAIIDLQSMLIELQ